MPKVLKSAQVVLKRGRRWFVRTETSARLSLLYKVLMMLDIGMNECTL